MSLTPQPLEPVEAHPAMMWDCPNCGEENFDRCRRIEYDPPRPQGEGFIVRLPETVKCQTCGETFDPEPEQ